MEKYYIDKDIKVFYVTAASFPEGVGGAFQKLLSFLPKPNERLLFGISSPNEKENYLQSCSGRILPR